MYLDHVDGFSKFLNFFFVEKYFFLFLLKKERKKGSISQKYNLSQKSEELYRFLVKFPCLKCYVKFCQFMTKNNFHKSYQIARMAPSLNLKSRRKFYTLFYAPRQQKIFRCPVGTWGKYCHWSIKPLMLDYNTWYMFVWINKNIRGNSFSKPKSRFNI